MPKELRLMLAKEPEALSAVGRIFIEQIFRWQRSIGIRIGLPTTSAAKEKLCGGAICFPQRFGGSLNLNVHFHVIVPDALFYRDTAERMCIQALSRPTRAELEDITYNVSNRCIRWLKENGHLEDDAPKSDPTLMEACLHGSVGIGSLAALSHRGETRRVTGEKAGAASHRVRGGSFNIHGVQTSSPNHLR